MNIKKITALLCAVVMVLSLAACGSNGDKAENKHYTVGICQLVQHDALDAATKGFRDAITDALGADNVTFDEQNAAGDSATCATICNGFVSSGVDLILANATGALPAAAAATRAKAMISSPSRPKSVLPLSRPRQWARIIRAISSLPCSPAGSVPKRAYR